MSEREFAVWAPRPDRVQLDVDGTLHAMERGTDDWWRATVAAGPDSRYGFVLDDDDTVLPDPRSARQPDGTGSTATGGASPSGVGTLMRYDAPVSFRDARNPLPSSICRTFWFDAAFGSMLLVADERLLRNRVRSESTDKKRGRMSPDIRPLAPSARTWPTLFHPGLRFRACRAECHLG